MTKLSRLSVAVLSALGILALLTAALVFYPLVHNHHIHPLGQLRDDISIGQPYTTVEGLFDDYLERYQSNEDLAFSKGKSDWHLFKGPMPEAEQLFLYDLSVFDDLQLQVLFDEAGRVQEINFVGD